ALCAFVLRGPFKEGDNLAIRVAKNAYQGTLQWALQHRWPVVSGAVILLMAALFVFSRLGAEFVPRLDEGSMVAMVFRTNSISLDAALEMQEKTEQLLLERVPEIERVFS